jgi:glyoxylase-like metal-dependent hydrolase (beta-lactamase superfamily II)
MEIEKGLTLEVIAVPGHTWDSTAYYVPERKILVAGEAAGCDGVCEFLVDHETYRDSLKILAELDVEILCTAHNLVLTGTDVKTHMIQSMLQVDEYVLRVKQYLKEEEANIDRVVARIKAAEWDEKPLPKQPLQAYLMSTKIRVKIILKHMGA